MPGTSVVFDRRGKLEEMESSIKDSLDSLVYDRSYAAGNPLKTENLYLGYTRHENYTIRTYADEKKFICVDGFIYGKPENELESEVRKLFDQSFYRSSDYKEYIKDFMMSTDGEYAVFMFEREKKELLIFNDPLCRHPLYYFEDEGIFMVSREPGFIINFIGKDGFDKRSIYEYLLLGYPIECRTLFRGVRRLPGGALTRINMKIKKARIEKLHIINFEEKTAEEPRIDTHAEKIAEYLHSACAERSGSNGKNILALSGGLDSRTVAGCLNNSKVPFSTVTFQDFYGIVEPDVQYARKIADALGVQWELYTLKRAVGRDCLELLDRRLGTNYLGLSFSVALIKKIMEKHGEDATLFTGDGGDRVLRDTRPVGDVPDVESLAEYIIEHNNMIALDTVSKITGMAKNEFIDRLREILEGYEERDIAMKYLRFIFTERCPGWHFQGEERNRSYLRAVTPFYSIEMFRYSMSLPDSLKKNFRLYRKVLEKISPKLASINNAEWGFPITSWKLPFYCLARRMYFELPVRLKRILEKKHRRGRMSGIYNQESGFMKCLQDQLESCEGLSDYLSLNGIKSNIGSLDKLGLDHLFTLTSVIERLCNVRSSLEKYMDQELL